MYIVPPSRRGCSIPSSTVSRITSPSRDQGTYMITLNPAARSCLPRPIVNLWWKWWLSLKFASHFIFWCYRLKKFSWFYSACSGEQKSWMKPQPRFHVNFSAALPSMHSSLSWSKYKQWNLLAGIGCFLSSFWSFSVLALSIQRTWMYNTIQVCIVSIVL